eukprot:TRINITY_DN33403_c0_g1_i4.p1 TRINITY_DN33403_c0_g1~~TRINITY_DN33403_c0_g1_i4.p1  ORF type:complete len:229 (+),score=58.11 TRINITY_DN33403_c0_g1_i4:116-802(+)
MCIRDSPHLQSMITLSPMPGFRRWVKDERALANSVSIAAAFERLEPTQRSELLSATGASDPALALSGMLKRPNWWLEGDSLSHTVTALLKNCSVEYLQSVKFCRGRPRAVDPVANFHLRNGAEISSIIGGQEKMRPSYGLMVQYEYKLEDVESNNHQYMEHGVVTLADAIVSHTQEPGATDVTELVEPAVSEPLPVSEPVVVEEPLVVEERSEETLSQLQARLRGSYQ